jgi:hypothetical protein
MIAFSASGVSSTRPLPNSSTKPSVTLNAPPNAPMSSPMPDPAIAAEGVFAEAWQPLGDGAAPWSRWSGERNRSEREEVAR